MLQNSRYESATAVPISKGPPHATNAVHNTRSFNIKFTFTCRKSSTDANYVTRKWSVRELTCMSLDKLSKALPESAPGIMGLHRKQRVLEFERLLTHTIAAKRGQLRV